MPVLADCPVCDPTSPHVTDKPWTIGAHRMISEFITREGRAQWKERRLDILAKHQAFAYRLAMQCANLIGHAYVKTSTRRPRDLFRKRIWLHCFECGHRTPWREA